MFLSGHANAYHQVVVYGMEGDDADTNALLKHLGMMPLFLIFGGWAMTGMGGGMMGRGYRMGHGWINGGFSWLWIPTLLTFAIGVLLGWVIFGKK